MHCTAPLLRHPTGTQYAHTTYTAVPFVPAPSNLAVSPPTHAGRGLGLYIHNIMQSDKLRTSIALGRAQWDPSPPYYVLESNWGGVPIDKQDLRRTSGY